MPNWKKVIVSGSDALLNSLEVTNDITSSGLLTDNFAVNDTLGIGAQTFYAHGADGFSVNEDFNAGSSNQTAYHFTSGDVNRTSVAFSLARTTQFTNMFGVTGSSSDNKFVIGGEFGNTDFEWRTGLGISPIQLQGGTLLARLNKSGSLYVSSSITGSDITIDDWGSISASLAQIDSGQFLTATNSPTKTEGSLKFNDSVKAIFGTGGDMEIYHDGSNSIIKDVGTGVLELQTNGTEIQLNGASGADYMARFINNGAVNLYYDNSKKLETTNTGATVTGDLDADDITIDGWGSVSASLASLNSEVTSVTLQEVLDASNGTATASGSIYLTSSAASLDFEYTVLQAGTVVAEGGSGLFSTPNTSSPSSHFTTALTMGSPHSASVASSLKSNTGFSANYRGQKRQLFPSDYVSAASQSMYVEYAEGANQNDNGTAYFQVDLDTKSPEYLLPLTASRLYVRAGETTTPAPLTVEENIVITSSAAGNGGRLDFGTITNQFSATGTINSPATDTIGAFSLATHIGAKYDYVVYLGTRNGGGNITHRAGTFMATWDEAGNISYSETTTTDNQSGGGIPSTSGFTMYAQTGVGSTCEIVISNTTGYAATIVYHRTVFRTPY